MSKITRYDGDFPAFGEDFQSQERTAFGTEDVGQNDLTQNMNQSWLRGWGIISPSEFPPIQYFNALGFTLSRVLEYLHQMGVAEWHVEQEYHTGSFTQKGSSFWASKTDDNVGNDPETDDGTNWVKVPNAEEVESQINDLGVAQSVDSVSTIRASSFPANLERLWLSGYYGVGTAGGGPLYRSSGTDDGGIKFEAGDGSIWERPIDGVVTISMFGVVADNDGTTGVGTDNTDALERFGEWVNGQSGITAYGTEGWVRFSTPIAGSTMSLSDVSGVDFYFGGTNFFDEQSHQQDEKSTFCEISDFSEVTLIHGVFRASEYSENFTGTEVLRIGINGHNITHIGITEGGLGATISERDVDTSTESEKTSGVKSFLKCKNTQYPFNLRHNGDHGLAYIDCEGAKRPFFVYGVDTVTGFIKTKGQSASSGISSFNGRVTRNIKLFLTDTETESYPTTSDDMVELGVNGSLAGLENIDLVLNIKWGSNSHGHMIGVSKYDGGSSGVITDLGTFFRNISVSGELDFNGQTGNIINPVAGGMHANEVVDGISIKDLSVLNDNANISLAFFDDADVKGVSLENVVGAKSVLGNVPLTATNVYVSNILSDNDARQTYIGCDIPNGGGNQSTTNKEFINTTLQGSIFEKTEKVISYGENGNFVVGGYSANVTSSASTQTFDTGITVYSYKTQTVLVSYKNGSSARIDTEYMLFNVSGAAGSDTQFTIQSLENSGGMGSVTLAESGTGTLTVSSVFDTNGVLSVSVNG